MTISTSTDGMLKCPNCGHQHPHAGIHTHIVSVTVVARKEDQTATKVHIVTDTRDNITISETNEGRRRDHTTLTIWCEECGQTTNITFTQNKGSTYITCEPVL